MAFSAVLRVGVGLWFKLGSSWCRAGLPRGYITHIFHFHGAITLVHRHDLKMLRLRFGFRLMSGFAPLLHRVYDHNPDPNLTYLPTMIFMVVISLCTCCTSASTEFSFNERSMSTVAVSGAPLPYTMCVGVTCACA